MRPISLKLDEEQIDEIDAEADERDLTRSQYLRRIIDARHETDRQTGRAEGAIESVNERIEGLSETVDALTERVRALEERDRRDTAPGESKVDRQPTQKDAENDERAASIDRKEQATPVGSDVSGTSEEEAATATSASIDEVLTGWRPGRNQEKREQQRAAGRAVLEWLRDQEVASASEFKAHVETEAPVTGQSPPTWWKKTAREALKRAQEAGLVEFVDGRKEWKWRG